MKKVHINTKEGQRHFCYIPKEYYYHELRDDIPNWAFTDFGIDLNNEKEFDEMNNCIVKMFNDKYPFMELLKTRNIKGMWLLSKIKEKNNGKY